MKSRIANYIHKTRILRGYSLHCNTPEMIAQGRHNVALVMRFRRTANREFGHPSKHTGLNSNHVPSPSARRKHFEKYGWPDPR